MQNYKQLLTQQKEALEKELIEANKAHVDANAKIIKIKKLIKGVDKQLTEIDAVPQEAE